MKYKKYITLTLSIFVLFCCFGIAKEVDACTMKDGKKGVTVNGKCVRFSSSGCGNFNLNSGHYGGDQQCALLGLNCPPPPPPPVSVCTPTTRCNDGKGLDVVRSDCSTGYTSCMNLGCKVGTSACNTTCPDGSQPNGVTGQCATAPTTGNIEVARYGDITETYSAPAGTLVNLGGGQNFSENPKTFIGKTPGNYTINFTNLPTYTKYVGTCSYAIGSPSCNVQTSSFSRVPCTGAYCSYTNANVVAGRVTKVGVKYVSPLSNIEVFRIVAADTGSSYTIANGSTVKLNNGTPSSVNPETFTGVVAGSNNTITVSRPDTNTSAYLASCEYSNYTGGCYINLPSITTPSVCSGLSCTFSNIVGSTSNVDGAVMTKKIWVMYKNENTTCNNGATNFPTCLTCPAGSTIVNNICTPNVSCTNGATNPPSCTTNNGSCLNGATNPPTCTCPAGQIEVGGVCTSSNVDTGSIKVVRYGADLAWPSTAPAGTFARVDSLSQKSNNPADFINLTAGSHTIYVTDIEGYTESFGSCLNDEGATECNISGSAFNTPAVCAGGVCSVTKNVAAGNVTKVGVKYTANTSCSNGATNYPACDNSVCTNGSTNFPTCDNTICINGATNFPTCTTCVPGVTMIDGICGGGDKCANGATNYPNCTVCLSGLNMVNGICGGGTSCSNGAANYPACDNGGSSCSNGATNPPTCTTNNGSCLNGATNPPTCSNGGSNCTNGATNPPTCTTNNGSCVNGSTNPPQCNVCATGATMVGGVCSGGDVTITTFKASPDTVNDGATSNLIIKASGANTCTVIGHNVNPGASQTDSRDINLTNRAVNTTITTGPITGTTRYTLVCSGNTVVTKVLNVYINPTSNER